MKHFKTILFSVLPFAVYSVFQSFAADSYRDQDAMRYISFLSLCASLGIVAGQAAMRDGLCFPRIVAAVLAVLTAALYAIPADRYACLIASSSVMNALFLNPAIILYSALAVWSIVPQMIGFEPFTAYFAKMTTDKAFWKTKLFRAVNVRISSFWGGIFLLCLAAQAFPWNAARVAASIVIPLLIGAPLSRKLVPYFRERLAHVERGGADLSSALDAVKGIPMICDRSAMKNVSAVIQFRITGNEVFDAHLDIAGGACVFRDGVHPSPSMTISSSSDVWLKISRGELDGARAYLSGLYTVSGDSSLLAVFAAMAGGGSGRGNGGAAKTVSAEPSKAAYASIPLPVKKVVAVMGSPRGNGASKSELLAQSFLEGCREAGAQTEVITLRDKRIEHCTGCYSCWTRTPGRCVFSDDAAELHAMAGKADLVVWAFPLYHFGINSLMKKFIERSLPMCQPYLAAKSNGDTGHPLRAGYERAVPVVAIAAAGFPELSRFDAASANIRAIASSAQGDGGFSLVAELYRPAAEALAVPFYAAETARVLGLVREAGMQAVRDGRIDPSLAADIGRVGFDTVQFSEMANLTWDRCASEGKTLAQMQQEIGG